MTAASRPSIASYAKLPANTPTVNNDGSNAVVSRFHYVLRADGKRLSVTDATGTTYYSYDNAGKLTEENGPYADIVYTYDAVGNRLSRTVINALAGNGTTLVNGTTTNTYDANDRLTSGSHSYDLDGNETTVNGQAASYDFENHLVSLGSTANYFYDADGNRTSVSSAGTTTNYVVDTSLPYASVVEEYNGTTLAARYDYGDDLVRMNRSSPASVSYYLFDGLCSTRQLVNTSGTVTDGYGYSAFGEMASRIGTTINSFLFNAQQFDQASGDYYLRARYYDQSNGRFISQAPYSGRNDDPVTLHRYLYAGVNPISNFDPDGDDFSLSEAAISTGIQATLGGVISGAVVNILGGSVHQQLLATLYGAEAAGALGFAAVASENFIQTLSAGLLGGATAVVGDYILDHFVYPSKSEEFTAPGEYLSFLQGFDLGAVPTALNLSNNPIASALLTGGVTFTNDLYKSLLTGEDFAHNKDLAYAFGDAVTQGLIALVGAGVQPALDGTSLGKKEVIDFIVNKVKASESVYNKSQEAP